MNRAATVSIALGLLGSSGCMFMYRTGMRLRMEGKAAPDFELAALDGGKVRLSELRGKPVLLAFWAHG